MNIKVELIINGHPFLSCEVNEGLVEGQAQQYCNMGRNSSAGRPWEVFVYRKSKFSGWASSDINTREISKMLHRMNGKRANAVPGKIHKSGKVSRRGF